MERLIAGYRAHYGGIKQKIITDGVRTLHEMFTGQRPRKPGYLARHNLRQAYVCYYLLLNYVKTRLVLRELKEFAAPPAAARVLDFGSGPGSASLAAADELEKPQLTLVDIVGEALTDAEWLLGTHAAGRASFRFHPEAPAKRFDVVIAANVLAELRDAAELRRVVERLLEPSGHLVLIEPALEETTRRLTAWRDELAASGWKIAAPCMGAARCPMASDAERWCHQDRPWGRPSTVAEIDRRIGLDRESLPFSYLIATKSGRTRAAGGWRVVSNAHRANGRVWMTLCGAKESLVEAELLTRFRGEGTADFEHARRGDVLRIEPEPSGRFAAGTKVTRT
jgi:ribosomal protein RSM22 (predicted rRNA methylase)